MNRRRFVRRAAAAGLAAPLLGAGAASARTASAAGLPEAVGSEAGATVYDGPLRGVAPITVTGVGADQRGGGRVAKVAESAGGGGGGGGA
ncbi:MAG: hypothetical protein AAF594_10560, partial [Bacteroidota bacterium]